MERRTRPAVIGVVGDSGTGKTSLLERLIPALAAHGLAVGVVKHASHGFEADRPGKDSHRLYGSGAAAVALVSDEALACFVRRPHAPETPRLDVALAALPRGLDLVLVEGFAWEAIPRLVVVREGCEPSPRYTESGAVLEVVYAPESTPGAKPVYTQGRIDSLAAGIAGHARTQSVAGTPRPTAAAGSPAFTGGAQ